MECHQKRGPMFESGKVWQEVHLTPVDDSIGGPSKIAGKHTYRYIFEARVSNFTQLLPNYMHIRFSDACWSAPAARQGRTVRTQGQLLLYLKTFDVTDETVSKRMKFAGKLPVWIPMPPH